MHARIQAFTLLELSVVIALIGVLSGIVLAGQGLVERSQLRRVVTDTNSYALAIHQFKDKYQWLPGDMPTATSLWGRADGGTPVNANCANPAGDTSAGKPTCNGNGDGIIDAVNCEYYRAWQQMAAAELIDGTFTGIGNGVASCEAHSILNVNVPGGSISNSAYSIASFGEIDSGADLNFFDGNYNNIVFFGGGDPNSFSNRPILKADAAHEIDRKVDDGAPNSGEVRATRPSAIATPNCVNTSNAYNELYRDDACSLIFMGNYLNHSTNR